MSDVFVTLFAVFVKLVNMSIAAGWLILVIIAVRILLEKAPKWIPCTLWALAALRLICPYSFESACSLIPSGETVMTRSDQLFIQSGINVIDNAANDGIGHMYFEGITVEPRNTLANPIVTLAVIWIIGAVILLAYALISCIKLRKSVNASIVVKDNIMRCDEVKSPFILGIIKPVIYVPSAMDDETMALVVTHERAHLTRRDHWWKFLGYLLLSVYWFHPLIWVGYILFCRDMEMACDERVIRGMDNGGKAAYSQALLDCSFPRKAVSVCPLAFGEVGVKERVKSVLYYKKPALWMVIAAAAVCIAVAVCFLTNPKAYDLDEMRTTVLQFCRYRDLGEDIYFGKNMDADFARSLAEELSPVHDLAKSGQTAKENYRIQVELKKKDISAQEIRMIFRVETNFRYASVDYESGYSEEVRVIYDCGRKVITDFRFLYPEG